MTQVVIESDDFGTKLVYKGNKHIGYLEEISDGTMLHFIVAVTIEEQIAVLSELQRYLKECS